MNKSLAAVSCSEDDNGAEATIKHFCAKGVPAPQFFLFLTF